MNVRPRSHARWQRGHYEGTAIQAVDGCARAPILTSTLRVSETRPPRTWEAEWASPNTTLGDPLPHNCPPSLMTTAGKVYFLFFIFFNNDFSQQWQQRPTTMMQPQEPTRSNKPSHCVIFDDNSQPLASKSKPGWVFYFSFSSLTTTKWQWHGNQGDGVNGSAIPSQEVHQRQLMSGVHLQGIYAKPIHQTRTCSFKPAPVHTGMGFCGYGCRSAEICLGVTRAHN